MALPFKSYLQVKANYKGGKSLSEVAQQASKIYKLSSNENAIGASPKAMVAAQKALNSVARYPDRTDNRLRAALANFYQEQSLQAHQFVTANSGVAIIEMIITGFMEAGSECIYSAPGFSAYIGFTKKFGAIPVNVPLIGDDYQLDVAGILNAITDKTRVIFTTSPNNPTGTHIKKKQMDSLINQLPNNILLVYDEVYYQYVDAQDYVRGYHYVNKGKNVIAVNSFSKAYGLAGLRVGYGYSTPEISQYLHNIRRPFLINAVSMEAAMAALTDEAFIQQVAALNYQEKHYLYKELTAIGVKYAKTQANFLLIHPGIDAFLFEQLMLREGIMVRPAREFGSEGVRVTIGQREENDAFIKALKKVLYQFASSNNATPLTVASKTSIRSQKSGI